MFHVSYYYIIFYIRIALMTLIKFKNYVDNLKNQQYISTILNFEWSEECISFTMFFFVVCVNTFYRTVNSEIKINSD